MDFLVSKKEMQGIFKKIKNQSSNNFKIYSGKVSYCLEILELYHRKIQHHNFSDPSAEILFFKEVKQIPQAYYIYYCTLLEFEFEYRGASEVMLEEAILAKMAEINSFLRTHLEFVKYIELNRTHLDHQYFTRATSYHDVYSVRPYYRDPKFSTSHDLLLSEIIACRYLIAFLPLRLRNKKIENNLIHDGTEQLQWTSRTVDLVELAYALHTTGAINHGNISLKNFMERLEQILGVDLGDYHHSYSQLRSRKNPNKFLDKLKQGMDQRAEKLDE